MIADLHQFLFWAFVGILLVVGVFLISISRKLEKLLGPFLAKLHPYAPHVSRVTLGLAFLAAAWFDAAFGPELPLVDTWSAAAPVVRILLGVLGVMLVLNLWTRVAAIAGAFLFATYIFQHGIYMLTYANYAGELAVLLMLGGTAIVARKGRSHDPRHALAFFVLRVAFGASLLYASVYAKILHNQLALDVAALPLAGHMTSVAATLGFEPHFLVLGAAIVEIVIALFFILGIEIRFTALFLEFWLTLSLLYFGEVVWPHLILIGIPIAFICYGYDGYSLEGRFFKKGRREPVL